MPGKKIPKDADAYIAAAPEAVRSKLNELRSIIKSAAPSMAEEIISYGMPFYKYHGNLVGFAAYKDHLSLFGAIPKELEPELKSYKTGRGSIQFPLEKPLPRRLIRKIVRARAERNESHQSK